VPALSAAPDVAFPGKGLPPGAAGWAVALGRRCTDVTRISLGEHAVELTENDTRNAIEGSMLSLLRRLGGDSVPVLNDWQLALARTMARLDWPYERYILGLRIAQDVVLEALLARAVQWGPADTRPTLLLALVSVADTTGTYSAKVGTGGQQHLVAGLQATAAAQRRRYGDVGAGGQGDHAAGVAARGHHAHVGGERQPVAASSVQRGDDRLLADPARGVDAGDPVDNVPGR
jgi:hypothetical protein